MPALVVASEEEQGIGIPHLQGPEVQYTLIRTISETLVCTDATVPDLDAEVSPVDVFTKEEIPCVRWATTELEKLHEVVLKV